MTTTLFWTLILVGAFAAGFALAWLPHRGVALFLAAFAGWLIFLGFNIYSEHHSPDQELLQGTFWFFQATEGTFAGLVSLIGCIVGRKIRSRSNKVLQPTPSPSGLGRG